MHRLFSTLRKAVERQEQQREHEQSSAEALPGFENRVEVLCKYAENAAHYEDDLTAAYESVEANMGRLQQGMEDALDAGRDRDALEYLRLAARIRPQRDLLEQETRAFHAVATELILRVNTLMENIDEARSYARIFELNPAASQALDQTLTRLTRYFVMLERVATARRRSLPERLAQALTAVMDDRQLDLELARYVLARRRALGSGNQSD